MNKNEHNLMPLISIIMVTYNAGKTLEYSIQSIIAQAYQNIEFIIIDGGSTDHTLEIIKKYSSSVSCWITEPDKGIYDAMNKGIGMATGDWLYFLGAGDFLLNTLHKTAAFMTDKSTIYYGNVYRNNSSEIYDGKFSGFKLAVNNICHQAIFYPASALKKYKYNLQYKTLADHDLNMRLFGDKVFKFTYIPFLISIYDGDGYSEINNIDQPFFDNKLNIIKDNFSLPVYYYAYLRRKAAKILKR